MKYLLVFFLYALNFSIAQDKVIRVWSEEIPGSIKSETYIEKYIDRGDGKRRLSHVKTPTLSVFTPIKPNGTAIIICPGGGYSILADKHEGDEVAAWLNKAGITGIVLRYRLPNDTIMTDKTVGPLQDAQEAVRTVRRNAALWGIKSDRIGIMGFSAGGHLAAVASTHFSEKIYEHDSVSARPDFSVLVYPVISMKPGLTHSGSMINLLGSNPADELIQRFSNELQVTKDTPPAFIVHSADDRSVPVENSISYFSALKRMGITGEMHIYEKGGHGYGLAENTGTQSAWPDALLKWIQVNGF
ncbi:MAG: alpha/beta hydrolase [Syntrophothermus sp.]